MVHINRDRICPDCKSKRLAVVNSELVCGKCGLVLSEGLFAGSELVA